MATPEVDVDPNDVGPSVPAFTSRVFSDDVMIEGPYLPESASTTLVETVRATLRPTVLPGRLLVDL